MSTKQIRNVLAATMAALASGAAFQASASGFAITEQSASGLGNAFAGAAAVAEDASTIYFNPAGMTYLPGTQLVVAGHLIMPKADFSNSGSYVNPLFTGGVPAPGTLTGGNSKGGVNKVVPNIYLSHQVNDTVFVGLGINAPFGLATKYDSGWVGRYHALESNIKTVNFNPSIAWKASDQLSLGIGLNVQYIEATLSNAVDFFTVCQGLQARGILAALGTSCAAAGVTTAFGADGEANVTGDSWGWGLNLGAIWEFRKGTRVGLAYRSMVNQDLDGRAHFTVPANFQNIINAGLPLFTDTNAAASIDLPETFSFSLAHAFSDQWTLLADITWTRWSRFDQLRITYSNPNQPATVQPEHWKNTARYSLGAIYRPNQTWTFRGGVAYDEAPIRNDSDRTPRIPDNNRTWLALGVGYHFSNTMALDVGYAHLFVKDAKVNIAEVGTSHQLVGNYKLGVDILSAQLKVNF